MSTVPFDRFQGAARYIADDTLLSDVNASHFVKTAIISIGH